MGEAAFRYGTIRGLAGYEIAGTAGLVGKTYNVNLWALYATPSSKGLGSLVNALRGEAAAAGASQISITGTAIINPGIANISSAAAARFGLELTKVSESTIILRGAVP